MAAFGAPAVPSGDGAAFGREQDVGRPERPGEQRQRRAEQRHRAAGRGGEEHDPGRRQCHPHEVGATPRAPDRDRQRPDELQRHRDPERDPVERQVEAEIHRREHEPEHRHVSRSPTPDRPNRRTPDRHQRDRGQADAQEHRPRRPDLVEQLLGDRCADLDRDDSAEDEQHGACPRRTTGRFCGSVRMRGARHCLEPSPIDPSLDIAPEGSSSSPDVNQARRRGTVRAECDN